MLLIGKTDIGLVRSSNQDNYAIHEIDQDCCFCMVCDGMGGHNGGNIASEIAVKAVREDILSNIDATNIRNRNVETMIINAIKHANNAVFSTALKDVSLRGMGTTIVFVMIIDKKLHVAHVGDSRVYLHSAEGLLRITNDHSVVQEMIDRGDITVEEAENHPYKHIITRVLGVSSDVNIDYSNYEIKKGDNILLVSDGLTNMIDDITLEKFLKNNTNADVCEKLVNLANENGGQDNITVVLIKI